MNPPAQPSDTFPLKPHKNGQWYKSVWNSRTKKSEQFYFGRWDIDPKGEAALAEYQSRKDAIKLGLDKITKPAIARATYTVGQLIVDFMEAQHAKVLTGKLEDVTLFDYNDELTLLGNAGWAGAPAAEVKPEHFTNYLNDELVAKRKLGPHRTATVIRYIRAAFNWAVKNGRVAAVVFGTDFVPPSTDPESIAMAKGRMGDDEDGEAIFEPAHIAFLLERATPLFRAMILLTLNTGIGPKDIGRIKWKHIDLEGRLLTMRRGKTGIRREAFLWKRTVEALKRVATLKHNRLAIEQKGQDAHVFITRKNVPVVRVERVMKGDKLVGVKVNNSMSGTFSRWVTEGKDQGIIPKVKLTYYHLRHTYRTHADNCPDTNAVLRTMGHALRGMDRRYVRRPFEVKRLKRVAKVVYRRMFPQPKPAKPETGPVMRLVGGGESEAA